MSTRPNGKPHVPAGLRRDQRLQVSVTSRDLADLERIGEAWKVPASTALYFLAAGRLAELRGEAMQTAGGDLVLAVSRYLASVSQAPEDGASEPE